MSRIEVRERRRRINLALDYSARHKLGNGSQEEAAQLLLAVLHAWGPEPAEAGEELDKPGRRARTSLAHSPAFDGDAYDAGSVD